MSGSSRIEHSVNRPAPVAGRVGVSLAAKLVSVVSGLCFIAVTTREFSKEEVAVLAVAAIMTSVMDVSKGLGLGPLLMKRLPGLLANSGGAAAPQAGSLIASYMAYSAAPPAILAAAGWASAPALSNYWFGGPGYAWEIRLGIAAGLATVVTNSSLALLLTARRFADWAKLSGAASMLQRMAPCAVAALFPVSLGQFMTAMAVLSAAASLPALWPVAGLIRAHHGRILPPAAFWLESRHYYGSSVLRYLAAQADQLLVAALCEPASLAVYYVLRRLYSIAVMTMDSFFDALVPDLSKRAAEDAAGARALLDDWVRLTFYGGTIGAAALAANGPRLVDLIAGAGYSDSRLLLAVFAATAVSFFLLGLSQVDILLFGESQSVLTVAASSAGVGGVSGAVLGSVWGPVGLAAGLMAGHWAGLLAARRAGRGYFRLRTLAVAMSVIAAAGLLSACSEAGFPAWFALLLGNGLIVLFGWVHYRRWQVEACLRRIQ
ncbi:MAG: hypothetical protein R2729_08175 [Bryobacteraceae bacterium]